MNINQNVEGDLTEKEGQLLFSLARYCPAESVIVEIGSWKGRSTVWLGKGSQSGQNVKIYAIDPHTGSIEHQKLHGTVWTFDEFKKNISKMQIDDKVTPLVMTSQQAALNFKDAVGCIFIDGSHEFDDVKMDFDLWFPKVIEKGMIAFHDTNNLKQGPYQLIKSLVFSSKTIADIKFVDSIMYCMKKNKISITDQIINICRFIFFTLNVVLRIFIRKYILPK